MDAPEKTDKPKNIRVRILTIVAGVVGVVGVGYLFSQSCLFLASIAGDLELRYYGIATRGTVNYIPSRLVISSMIQCVASGVRVGSYVDTPNFL